MIVLAIDPGLDAVGLALFEVPALPDGRAGAVVAFQSAVQACTDLRVLRSKPATPMPERLGGLFEELDHYCRAHWPALVVLEEPSTSGSYAERKRRQRGKSDMNARSLELFYQGFGVLQAAAHGSGATVVRWPAIGMPKPKRHHIVRLAGQHAPAGHPVAVLLGKLRASPDLLDAVYLGASTLASGVLARVSA